MESLRTDKKYFSNSIDYKLIQCVNTCSKLTIKVLDNGHGCCFSVFIVGFNQVCASLLNQFTNLDLSTVATEIYTFLLSVSLSHECKGLPLLLPINYKQVYLVHRSFDALLLI